MGPHVLLVEDSATTARATASMLADGGIIRDVAIAADVDGALKYLGTDSVDLLVLDLNLPGRQGLELLSDVRSSARWRRLPVVVFSGVADPAVVQRSYELGANCFIRKPQTAVEMAPAIRAIEEFWSRHVQPTDEPVFQLPLAATAESVREARAIVRHLLQAWHMEAVAETAELCTSELATNAVIHARSPVLLVVSQVADGVRVGVEDKSPGPLQAGSLDGEGESGRGLALVDTLSACWGVEQQPQGKTVWFEVHRSAGSGE